MLVCMIRSIILYFLLICAIRLMGKRQIGQLEPSEFVVSMLLADLASVPMQDLGIPLLAGVIPILTVLALEVLLSVLSYYILPVRKALCGTPVVLIDNGRILEENLKSTRITTDELMEQFRQKNILDLSTVQYAILETSGQISAFVFPAFEAVTKKDLKLTSQDQSIPISLISDGKILRKELGKSIYSETKLLNILQKKGLCVQNIFLLTSDADGSLFIAEKQVKK